MPRLIYLYITIFIFAQSIAWSEHPADKTDQQAADTEKFDIEKFDDQSGKKEMREDAGKQSEKQGKEAKAGKDEEDDDPCKPKCKFPVELWFNNCYSEGSRGFWHSGGGLTLRVGGNAEIEALWFGRHSNNPCDFRTRRSRIILEGTIFSTFRFYLRPLWNYKTVRMEQCYIETMIPKYALIRFGHIKIPFSMESIREDLLVDFNERALWLRNFLPPYDTGIMIWGKFLNKSIEYRLGVFNGTGDAIETNSKKEFVGRIVIAPFLMCECAWFRQSYFGVSGSVSRQQDDLSGVSYTTAGETIFWKWKGNVANPVFLHGMQWRQGADFEYYNGPFAFHTECYWTKFKNVTSQVGRFFVSVPFIAQGYYVEATYLLTGETKVRDEWVVPFHNFDPCKGGWGAFELAGRYETLFFDKKPLREGLAIGTRHVKGYILGLNWYPNPFTALRIDYERYHFSNRIPTRHHFIKGESLFITRLQCEF